MSRILTVVTARGAEHDVELTAPESLTMWDLAVACDREWHGLWREPPFAAYDQHDGIHAPRLSAGGDWLPPDLTLAESPLRDGVRLGLAVTVPPPEEPSPLTYPKSDGTRHVEVCVVAGEAAGSKAVLRWEPGRFVELFTERLAPGDAVRVEMADSGDLKVRRITGTPSVPGVRNGTRAFLWGEGALLTVGRSVLRWTVHEVPEPEVLPPGEHGTLLLDPRTRPQSRPLAEGVPADFPSSASTRDRWWHGEITRRVHRMERTEQQQARLALRALENVPLLWPQPEGGIRPLAGLAATAVDQAADTYPGPGTAARLAAWQRGRLWQRRPADADFLALRCGLRTAMPPGSERPGFPQNEGAVALGDFAAPAVAVLPRTGVTGVVGTGDLPRRLAGWFALQAALHHSPEHVTLRVVTDPEGAGQWRWVRWLPHSSAALDEGKAARVHADPTSIARQIDRLLQLVGDRQSAAEAASRRIREAEAGQALQPSPPLFDFDGRRYRQALLDSTERAGAVPSENLAAAPDAVTLDPRREALTFLDLIESEPTTAHRHHGPAVLLVLDGIRRLRVLPGIGRLLKEGPAAGVHVLCLAAETRQLPPECRHIIDLGDGSAPTITAGDAAPYPFVPDLPPAGWCEGPARALAPLRDADAVRHARDLAALPLPELLGLEEPGDPAPIVARWSAVPRSTAAVVGQAAASPFELDLRLHGPHALVAGGRDSGLADFLRTWTVSLGVANRPDELSFVLFDYQGGAAFGPAADLPHVTRLVTDLDAREADRVLDRLSAALRVREAQLTASGTKDIDDYQELRARRSLPPLPRLVLVVAELATLARDLPQFVPGLVRIARRGRSLGVHLLLATQRPSGVLAPEIRADTHLRIALRLGSAAESADVIDAPDAAAIARTTPGRAFVRTGAQELTEFQAAAPYAYDDPRAAGRPVTIRELDGDRDPGPADAGPMRSHLGPLVQAVAAAAETLGVHAVPGPLPEPLPSVLTLSEASALPAPAAPPHDLAPVAYGVEELADEIGRQPALFDLAGEGALAATGGPRSGKSQFLRTLAAALAVRHGTADVHLFGIDCGNGALQALGGLPHCGTVVTRGRADHLARLVSRLTAALYTRQQLLAEGGFSDVAAQRQAAPAARRLPYLVLLLDRWEALRELAEHGGGERLPDDLRRLMRDGGPAGIRVVLTADAAGGLDPDTAALATEHLVLDRRDPADYRALGVDPPQGHLAPGRALRAFSSVELQIALVDGDLTSRGQSDALDRLAAGLRERDAHVPDARRPFTIDDAPRAAEQFHVGPGKGRPVGREDVLAWLRDRQSTGACAALLGPRRAGKTWVLEELSRRLAADGGRHDVHRLTVPPPSAPVDSPDALAGLLDRGVRDTAGPAEALLDKAAGAHAGRLVFLLDEVGRLAGYDPVAVSWLRDLGQAGAWLLYTGTEKDWRTVVRRALTAPGSSFGNDVNARLLGPLDEEAALDFLSGTAANLGVALDRGTVAAAIVRHVGSWPFYLQVAGDAVVRAVQGNDLGPLTGTDALHALIERRLLDEWSQHFASRWAEIGPAGRAALLAEPGQMPGAATPAQRQDLRDVGLLRPGEVWLDDRPLLAWIARNEISLRDGELPA
ncbi:FtsK/SpoIIIE domain-containing protein [Actinacidiphila epipremni]|uniref:FtsK domain-containing protein n=1 Tax=Actinacidiphila epipremni TaxID=2053013 RepID=A0ABX0ZRT7_9ACTN|nr:FtsK/SpoIIIE domain-containing protein [Actinacidiphila epipremni]NJP44258.1 hypothetical protein [Actinacidiphila epipremni]